MVFEEERKRKETELYEDDDDEIWKPVVGFEGLYEVSNFGRVKALERLVINNNGLQHKHERILKPNYSGDNRGDVILCKDGKKYPRKNYRLAAEAFIPNPENKPTVDHIDTNYKNNNINNLRWTTQQENVCNPLSRYHNSKSKMGHPAYNTKPLSEEARKKISEANKGKKLSEEHIRHLRESHLGYTLSQETKDKIGQIKKGHPVSEETREKIRQGHLKRMEGNNNGSEGFVV